ncbi:MAG: hypothetical protein JXO22_10045 [Phycisphaerae bacterium]|nr:hypothetical protein [Phycisphaerae bacterium]
MPKSLLALALILVFAGTSNADDALLYVPMPVADKIGAVETTKLDIGEPKNLFDNDVATLIRTPAINPAFVRFELTEPVTCEHLRLGLIDERHTWTLSIADNMDDLRGKTGSYHVLLKDQTSPHDRVDIALDEPMTFRAVQLDVKRETGDDYVHISEFQFCQPGTIDKLHIRRVINRREAHTAKGLTDVEGPITVPTQTVVWLMARAEAGSVELDLPNELEWRAEGDGIEPFGDTPGMFLVTGVGPQRIIASLGEFEQTIDVVGTAREITNRQPDIEILFIERLPRIDFDQPANDGWPAPSSTVTWRAHVYNWGEEDVPVTYRWKLDGKTLATGKAVIKVGPPSTDATLIDLPWEWEKVRHDLTLTVEPVEPLKELITADNTLTIQTDAVTVGLWVEQTLWEFHHANQHRLPTQDANSFAGWGQRMMRQWNKMFTEKTWPEYPEGIVERVRLDKVVVVPDFALPLHGGLPSNNPDLSDKTVDMTWGCESGSLAPGIPGGEEGWWSVERALKAFEEGRIEQKKEDPPFWCGLGYIHEMCHARYLVDGYGFNVHGGKGDDASKYLLQVTDKHGPILGRYMPADQDIQHWRKYVGMMGGDYWSWSVFEAMCWNRVRGQRARGGNCNAPKTIGEFLQDIPERVVLDFVDTEGEPLANAEVWVYRARGTGVDWYSKKYVDEPDLRTKADKNGRVVFDRTLWAEDGKIIHTYGHSNSVALLRVTYNGQHYFLFEEVTDANLAYNLGQRGECVFKRQIKLRDGEPSPDEWDVNARWEPEGTGFGKG